MHLIQILLPLRDNHGEQFSQQLFTAVREKLLKNFGGVTIFNQSAATGLWEDSDGDVQKDDLVIFEVMTQRVETSWWINYKGELEKEFEQDEIVIRATEIEKI